MPHICVSRLRKLTAGRLEGSCTAGRMISEPVLIYLNGSRFRVTKRWSAPAPQKDKVR